MLPRASSRCAHFQLKSPCLGSPGLPDDSVVDLAVGVHLMAFPIWFLGLNLCIKMDFVGWRITVEPLWASELSSLLPLRIQVYLIFFFQNQKNRLLKSKSAVSIIANKEAIFKTSKKVKHPNSQEKYEKSIRCLCSVPLIVHKPQQRRVKTSAYEEINLMIIFKLHYDQNRNICH